MLLVKFTTYFKLHVIAKHIGNTRNWHAQKSVPRVQCLMETTSLAQSCVFCYNHENVSAEVPINSNVTESYPPNKCVTCVCE